MESAVEVGTDDADDVSALLIMGVDLKDVDGRIVIDLRVDFKGLGVGAFLEDFGVAEAVDFLLGELMAFWEEDFAFRGDEWLSEDAARETVIDTEFLEVFITSGTAKVITLLIEEFLDEEGTEALSPRAWIWFLLSSSFLKVLLICSLSPNNSRILSTSSMPRALKRMTEGIFL